MFRVEIKDIDKLYDAMKSGGIYNLGALELSIDGVEDVYTKLKSEDKNFSLEGKINTNLIAAAFVPHEKLVQELSEKYEVIASSKTQVALKKDGREYYIESRYNGLNIKTKNKKSSKKEFEAVLNDYAEILTVFVNSYAAEKGCESNEIYLIGRDIRLDAPLKEESGKGFEGLFGISLGDLEKKIEIESPEVSFDQIGGCRQGKIEIMRIYKDIVDPEQARFFGRDPDKSKGYILFGESGNGKTFLVKALATKLKKELDGKVKFYAVNYEDITSVFRGGEAQATGKIFDLVERNEKEGIKTLLFLDELHLVGSRSGPHQPKDEALDTLLAHLDGMKKYKGLTVIGATYMGVKELDPALIREGRLSKWVTIEKPNPEERAEIFVIYIEQRQKIAAEGGNENLFGEIDMQKIAEATGNFNGSHIAGVVAAVIDWKEDKTKAKAEKEGIEVREAFTTITAEEFLEVIKSYEKVERPKRVDLSSTFIAPGSPTHH